MPIKQKNIFYRLKDSIYNGSINPKSNEERTSLIFKSLILHLHPPQINKEALKFNKTFGLGGMAVVLICFQFFSGLLLRFIYEPFPGKAYDSILNLQNNIFFGQLIRNIHYWSAMLLLIISLLHLGRVFLTGAFHGKRQFNWVIGVLLFVLLLFSNFTGYLLPWDQLSYWAVTVSTQMLGYLPLVGDAIMKILLRGDRINSSTLLVFYNLHTGVLPILIIFFMSFHFWRVRKAGGVAIHQNNKVDSFVSTVPNLVSRELVVALVLTAAVLLLSDIFNAPLLEKANPDLSPNPSKAPWYFLGIQELMLHFHPLFSAIIIPVIFFVIIILIPYFNYDDEDTGLWFYSNKGKSLAYHAVIFASILTGALVIADEYFINLSGWLNFFPDIISNGLIPFLIGVTGLATYYKFLLKYRQANRNEAIQTMVIFVFTILFVLTLTGILFRSEGMALAL